MKKKNATQWTNSNNVGRPRRTSNFCKHFLQYTKLSLMSRNTLWVLSPCRTEVTIPLTNQRTACVARMSRHPFMRLSTSKEEYCETSTAQCCSIRTPPTFGCGNAPHLLAVRTVPHLCIPRETRHNWYCLCLYEHVNLQHGANTHACGLWSSGGSVFLPTDPLPAGPRVHPCHHRGQPIQQEVRTLFCSPASPPTA